MTTPGPAGPALGAPPPRQPAQTSQPALEPATGAPEAAQAQGEPAAGAAAAAPTAPAAATAAAVPPVPGGPAPSGTPMVGGAQPERPAWRSRRHRRLHRLRIGQHVATDAALAKLHLTSTSFGLLAGWNQTGGPVALPLFQPEPTRVVLIGGPWAAKLLTFRSLGFGARLVVFTDEPTGWIALGRRATGRTDRVAVLEPGSPVRMVASADQPVLQLTPDVTGSAPASPPPSPAPSPAEAVPASPQPDPPAPSTGPVPPWTTRLSVLPRITAELAPLTAEADIVLTQRLSPTEAAVLAPALGVTERTAYTLQVLPDDMLAVLTPAGAQYAWVSPTSTELDTLGPPGRATGA